MCVRVCVCAGTSKYVEPFADGTTIVTLHLARAGNRADMPSGVASVMSQLVRDVSLLYPIPGEQNVVFALPVWVCVC